MALFHLTISGKVLGKSQNLLTTWQMALPSQANQTLTLQELLTSIVKTLEFRLTKKVKGSQGINQSYL